MAPAGAINEEAEAEKQHAQPPLLRVAPPLQLRSLQLEYKSSCTISSGSGFNDRRVAVIGDSGHRIIGIDGSGTWYLGGVHCNRAGPLSPLAADDGHLLVLCSRGICEKGIRHYPATCRNVSSIPFRGVFLAAGLALLTRGTFVRTLNLQLAAILMATGIVFSGGFYFLHGYQVERNAYVFKRESELLEQRGDAAAKKKDNKAAAVAYRDAARNLSWYVRLVPRDVDAMEKLGLMMADRAKDTASRVHAFGLLEQVLRVDPERAKVRRRLIPVAIRIGRFQDAKVHLEELLKESPQDAELWDLLGQCHLGRGEFESAANSFRKRLIWRPTEWNPTWGWPWWWGPSSCGP